MQRLAALPESPQLHEVRARAFGERGVLWFRGEGVEARAGTRS